MCIRDSLDTALVELFDQNFNVVTALERVLTVSAQTAVAGIRFKVMFGKTGVFKEVECFAGVLCEAVNRFLLYVLSFFFDCIVLY